MSAALQAIRWIAFLVLNAAIYIGWLGVLSRRRRLADRLLVAVVLSVCQAIVTMLLLGVAAEALTAPGLFVINGAIASLLLLLAGAGSIRLIGQELAAALRTAGSTAAASPVVKALAVSAGIAFFWLVFLGLIYPPVEWDSLMYHLPSVAYYIQQQSLSDPALPMDAFSKWGVDPSIWINAFPKNIELLFLWATMLPGTDRLVDLVELTFGITAIIAVYSLATKLGVDRTWSIAAGLLFFLTPIVLAQSRSNLIDLSNSALILVALNLLYSRDPRPSDIAVAGLAVGVVLGAKWSGLLFLVLLAAFAVAQRVYLRRSATETGNGRPLPADIGLLVGPAILMGGYWYIKNWYLYGNPLWPFPISVLGVPIFKGVIGRANILALTFPEQLQGMGMVARLWTTWREPLMFAYDYDMRLGGLGPFWFIFALPSLVYVVRRAIMSRQWQLLLLLATVGSMLILHPENWWSRYTMFIAGIGAVAFSMVRSAKHDAASTRIIDAALVATVVFSTTASFAANYYQPSRIASLLSVAPDYRTSGHVRPEIVSNAYQYIARRTAGKPMGIVYSSGVAFTYPLWGTALANRVYYVRAESHKRWVGRLRALDVRLVLTSVHSPEHRFVKNRPLFKRKFVDPRWRYEVYEFEG